MPIGIGRGKELVESLGEVGELVSFSTAITDSEEPGMVDGDGVIAQPLSGLVRISAKLTLGSDAEQRSVATQG